MSGSDRQYMQGPAKDPRFRKSRIKKFRVSPKDDRLIEAAAHLEGMTVCSWARAVVLAAARGNHHKLKKTNRNEILALSKKLPLRRERGKTLWQLYDEKQKKNESESND